MEQTKTGMQNTKKSKKKQRRKQRQHNEKVHQMLTEGSSDSTREMKAIQTVLYDVTKVLLNPAICMDELRYELKIETNKFAMDIVCKNIEELKETLQVLKTQTEKKSRVSAKWLLDLLRGAGEVLVITNMATIKAYAVIHPRPVQRLIHCERMAVLFYLQVKHGDRYLHSIFTRTALFGRVKKEVNVRE